MPKIDLTVPAGVLSDAAKQELPGKLAATLLRWEGAPTPSSSARSRGRISTSCRPARFTTPPDRRRSST